MVSVINPTKPEDGAPASKDDLRANLMAAKAELEHGGFAVGFTPSNYGTPATSKVVDHLAALDAALPGLNAGGLTGWVDVKGGYSATGNGTTDDTTAIQNALNSGADVVYFPAGTYKVSSALTIAPGTQLIGAGPGVTIIDGRTVGQSDSAGILQCSGSNTALSALSSSVTRHDGSIAYASAPSLKHGDWVRIADTTANSLNPYADNDGFYYMVNSAEGTTVYPASPCRRTLPATRTAGALANVDSELMDGRGIALRDLAVWGQGFDADSDDGDINGITVLLIDLANVYLDRVHVLGGASAAVQFRDCCNVHCSDCTFTVNQGDWNEAGAYACWVWGCGYATVTNCVLQSVRHAINLEAHDLPTHDTTIIGGFIGAPGTDDFQQPDSNGVVALDWHEGTYATRALGVQIHGAADLRGTDMRIENCTIDAPTSAANVLGTISCWKINNLDLKVINNDLYTNNTHWKGGGCVFELSENDLDQDVGLPGSFLFAGNRIFVQIDTTQSMIRVIDTTAKSPHTGKIHILGNQVVQCACSTSQPFLEMDVTDMEELVVLNNVLPSNVTLGTPDSASFDTYKAMNVFGGQLEFDGLPTSTPGGSGRLWSDGGTLKVT